jgi:PAS domain S-box-containing protein
VSKTIDSGEILQGYQRQEAHILFSGVILKIIEEISDGFLIMDQNRDILFFNEVLLTKTGWRSMDIFTRKEEFLSYLDIKPGEETKKRIEIPDTDGESRFFQLNSFSVQSQEGGYTLISLVSVAAQDYTDPEGYRERYDLLFNNLQEAFFTTDLDGRILSVNPSFCDFFGYSFDLVPETMDQLYASSDSLEEKIDCLKNYTLCRDYETAVLCADGVLKRVLDTSWVNYDPEGHPEGFTTHLKDVSYLKNIESRLMISEKNFTTLFETILSSIVIVDPLGMILNMNSAAEKAYGYTWEEIFGEHFDAVFRTDKKSPSFSKLASIVDRNEGHYIDPEAVRKCKDGEIKYTYASYSAIKDATGELIAYSVVEKDLTERMNLEKKLKETIASLKKTQSAAIMGFAKLTEYRDKSTGKHLERIREYTRVLAAKLRDLPQYRDYITDDYLEDIYISAILHDVGKVGIEDQILLKNGPLSEEEFKKIREHVVLGGEALRDVERQMQQESFLTIGKEIAYYHHERWDGKGYPEGRKGQEIPLSARIVALVDVYDALTSRRPYKEAIAHEEAVEMIRQERGKHFDPQIVDIFVENQEVFLRIKRFVEFEENPASIHDLLQRSNGEEAKLDEAR